MSELFVRKICNTCNMYPSIVSSKDIDECIKYYHGNVEIWPVPKNRHEFSMSTLSKYAMLIDVNDVIKTVYDEFTGKLICEGCSQTRWEPEEEPEFDVPDEQLFAEMYEEYFAYELIKLVCDEKKIKFAHHSEQKSVSDLFWSMEISNDDRDNFLIVAKERYFDEISAQYPTYSQILEHYGIEY